METTLPGKIFFTQSTHIELERLNQDCAKVEIKLTFTSTCDLKYMTDDEVKVLIEKAVRHKLSKPIDLKEWIAK